MNKEFTVSDVFTVIPVNRLVEKGKPYIPDKEVIGCGGRTPYIAAISTNNGITGYSYREPNNKGDCITLSTTAASPDTVFYQAEPFIGRQQMSAIRRKDGEPLGLECGLYIVPFIKLITQQFNYGTKLTNDYLRNAEISLPVIPSSDPSHTYTPADIDWQYMRDRIKELERDRIKELERDRIKELDAYLKTTGLDDYELTEKDKKVLSLSEKSASDGDEAVDGDCEIRKKEFLMSEIFNIKKGKRLTKADQITGKTLFVGSSAENHGETGRVGQPPLFPANTISVSYNGSVGEAFYQTEPYWASDDINVCFLKKHTLNPELGSYLCACIRKAGQIFAYSQKWNLERMNNTKISLPVTSSGEPDWDYMEKYIRAMEKVVIADVVKWKTREIEATKKMVEKIA